MKESPAFQPKIIDQSEKKDEVDHDRFMRWFDNERIFTAYPCTAGTLMRIIAQNMGLPLKPIFIDQPDGSVATDFALGDGVTDEQAETFWRKVEEMRTPKISH